MSALRREVQRTRHRPAEPHEELVLAVIVIGFPLLMLALKLMEALR